MDAQPTADPTDHAEADEAGEGDLIERALLNESEAGRRIAAAFVEVFGRFMREDVRPVLRDVAASGDQPQLLVNGLAELMRSVALTIEFPLDHPRSGFPPQIPGAAD